MSCKRLSYHLVGNGISDATVSPKRSTNPNRDYAHEDPSCCVGRPADVSSVRGHWPEHATPDAERRRTVMNGARPIRRHRTLCGHSSWRLSKVRSADAMTPRRRRAVVIALGELLPLPRWLPLKKRRFGFWETVVGRALLRFLPRSCATVVREIRHSEFEK